MYLLPPPRCVERGVEQSLFILVYGVLHIDRNYRLVWMMTPTFTGVILDIREDHSHRTTLTPMPSGCPHPLETTRVALLPLPLFVGAKG